MSKTTERLVWFVTGGIVTVLVIEIAVRVWSVRP
jgi:hypothetical protein